MCRSQIGSHIVQLHGCRFFEFTISFESNRAQLLLLILRSNRPSSGDWHQLNGLVPFGLKNECRLAAEYRH